MTRHCEAYSVLGLMNYFRVNLIRIPTHFLQWVDSNQSVFHYKNMSTFDKLIETLSLSIFMTIQLQWILSFEFQYIRGFAWNWVKTSNSSSYRGWMCGIVWRILEFVRIWHLLIGSAVLFGTSFAFSIAGLVVENGGLFFSASNLAMVLLIILNAGKIHIKIISWEWKRIRCICIFVCFFTI